MHGNCFECMVNLKIKSMKVGCLWKICILIPSLEPGYQLIQYVRELNTIENVNIVVVNDGSSKEYEKIFTVRTLL